jgi:hypothetical protein
MAAVSKENLQNSLNMSYGATVGAGEACENVQSNSLCPKH